MTDRERQRTTDSEPSRFVLSWNVGRLATAMGDVFDAVKRQITRYRRYRDRKWVEKLHREASDGFRKKGH